MSKKENSNRPSGPEQQFGTVHSQPMGGYNGKILRVNLSNSTISAEPLTYQFARKWIGGAGFIAYFLWKELPQGVDPLGPDNKLIFALGPITGLSLPGASRYCVGAKSPLTGGIGKSEAGGFWMAQLKRAGFDAIIIEGKAPAPVYLWINDGVATIEDARQLWGKDTKETQETILTERGDPRIEVVSIGPAGENMVPYACIMTGLHDAAGRGGLGAVMGSKNLKAIAVRGHHMPAIMNEEYIKTLRKELVSVTHFISEYGTGGPGMETHMESGDLPVYNQRAALFPDVKNIHGGAIKEQVRVKMEGCFACNVRCKKVVKFDEPYPCDPDYGGPEYETIGALGSNCGVGDLKAVCKGAERCNALSLDTISTGSSIAFAMECYERGLLTDKDTGGLELRFGNADAMLKAIELIARREGIGAFIGEGTARMAKKLGHGSEEFAMHVKGLEAAMHDPRAIFKFKIGYMFHPIGADHCLSIMSGGNALGDMNKFGILEPIEDTISAKRMSIAKLEHCLAMANDYLVICFIPLINHDHKLELIKAVTGWNTGWVELLKVSERIMTTMRLFNIREGFTAADDEFPLRYYQPKADGILSRPEAITDRATMGDARKWYYYYMGWDDSGVPTQEKLAELGLI